MTDILLAKPTLPHDFIDLSVGEAHVVRESLLNNFDVFPYQLTNKNKLLEYHDPRGYEPLVQLLEDKYHSPVIITNGAKQAIGAIMFALKKMGKSTIGLPNPYWCLLPPLIELHGLSWMPSYDSSDANLLVLPNNPDNWIGTKKYIRRLQQNCKDENIPLIHDAVYYNHIYLPKNYSLDKIGDAQIFSASKSYGLSGIRIGWIAFSNTEIYKHVVYYMETMTVGVSIASQILMFDLLDDMRKNVAATEKFEQTAADTLKQAKEIMLDVSQEILDIPRNLPDIPGMFLFCKIKDYSLLERARINAIDGKYFGAPGYVRINLALPTDQIKEVVQRLNSTKR